MAIEKVEQVGRTRRARNEGRVDEEEGRIGRRVNGVGQRCVRQQAYRVITYNWAG